MDIEVKYETIINEAFNRVADESKENIYNKALIKTYQEENNNLKLEIENLKKEIRELKESIEELK